MYVVDREAPSWMNAVLRLLRGPAAPLTIGLLLLEENNSPRNQQMQLFFAYSPCKSTRHGWKKRRRRVRKERKNRREDLIETRHLLAHRRSQVLLSERMRTFFMPSRRRPWPRRPRFWSRFRFCFCWWLLARGPGQGQAANSWPASYLGGRRRTGRSAMISSKLRSILNAS